MSPLVSIICTTHNHEAYIAQTIEGFLMQKTSFYFEILIHDDASTDKTKAILLEYEMKYPNRFNNIYQEENQYSKNLMIPTINLLSSAKGKYIAVCEGDDYWTDPLKLQKQFDFLESHPEISVSYHPVSVEKHDSFINEKFHNTFSRTVDGIFTFYNSLQGKNGATLSMMFRRDCLDNIPFNIFFNLKMGDWPLECICTLAGNGYIHKEVMGIYRIHKGGISNTFKKNDFYDSRLRFSKSLLELNITSIQKIFVNKFIFRILVLQGIYLLQNKYTFQAIKSFINSIVYIRLSRTNNLYCWDEKYNLKNAIVGVIKKITTKFFR